MAVFRNTSFFCSRTKHFQTMDMSQSYHYNNSKQSMLNGTQPFFCQLPSKKSRKPTVLDESSAQTTAFGALKTTSYGPDLEPNDIL